MNIDTTATRRARRLNRVKWRFPIVPTVTATAVLLSPHAGAEWKAAPSLALRQSYSDNITLAPKGGETSDYVTELTPRIMLTNRGPNLDASINYAMQNLLYARQNDSLRTFHLLNASLHANPADSLFVDAKGAIGQANISPFGQTAVDNLSVTGNRTNVRTYSISPYLLHRFRDSATTELRYTRDAVDTGSNDLLDNQSNRYLFKAFSGPAIFPYGWGFQYEQQDIKEDLGADAKIRKAFAVLFYRLSARWSLIGTAGHEDFNYVAIGDEPKGRRWSAGVEWRPTERTKVDASAGKRFFGDTYSLAASHRTRNAAFILQYKEDIISSRSRFLLPATNDTTALLDRAWQSSIPDNEARQQAVSNFIQNTGLQSALAEPAYTFTNRFSLDKTAQASIALTGARNSVLLGVFNTQRVPQSTASTSAATPFLSLSDDIKQTGVNATWTLRMSPRMSATAAAQYSRVESNTTTRKDTEKTLRLTLSRQIQPNIDGAIEVRRRQQDSNISGNDRRENAIAASLLIRF